MKNTNIFTLFIDYQGVFKKLFYLGRNTHVNESSCPALTKTAHPSPSEFEYMLLSCDFSAW